MILNNKVVGITLIELLVTLLILTIGIAGLVKFQGSYFYYSDVSKQRQEALLLAKTKMAALRNFQVLPTTTGYAAYDDITSGSASTTQNNATYTTTWTITDHTNPSYKTANIVVSWTDRRGSSQNLTLTSIISKTDPANSGILIYG